MCKNSGNLSHHSGIPFNYQFHLTNMVAFITSYQDSIFWKQKIFCKQIFGIDIFIDSSVRTSNLSSEKYFFGFNWMQFPSYVLLTLILLLSCNCTRSSNTESKQRCQEML